MVPRPGIQANSAAQAAFKNLRRYATVVRQEEERGRAVRLMFQDEGRYRPSGHPDAGAGRQDGCVRSSAPAWSANIFTPSAPSAPHDGVMDSLIYRG